MTSKGTTVAAILTAQRKPLVVDEVELPDRLGPGQVLVRVEWSGICGSQLGEIDGVKGPDPHLPHLLGHEGGGWVEEVGEGVRTVQPDDRVVLHWRPGAGLRSETPRYRWRGERLNAGWVTTFNERAVVSEDRVTLLPDGFPLDIAALLGCAVTTGFGVISNDARVLPGESVVVFGTGGVGLSVVQAAAATGAHPIVALDLHSNRLRLARELGATETVDAGGDGVEGLVREVVGAAGADVCVDCTGEPGVIELAVRLAADRGRVVLVGVPTTGQQVSLHTLQLHFGKRLIGSHGGGARPAEDVPRLIRLIDAGKLDLEKLVSARVELAAINGAISALRGGSIAGRCLVQMPVF